MQKKYVYNHVPSFCSELLGFYMPNKHLVMQIGNKCHSKEAITGHIHNSAHSPTCCTIQTTGNKVQFLDNFQTQYINSILKTKSPGKTKTNIKKNKKQKINTVILSFLSIEYVHVFTTKSFILI